MGERLNAKSLKRDIAVRLRDLRDYRGMTQADVTKASGMTQSSVARIESLMGPNPSLKTIERYVEACNGQMEILISAKN